MKLMPFNNAICHLLFAIRKAKGQSLKAFTLIELLIVISIIGILVAAATVSWTNAQQKSRDNKRKSDLKALQQALELYFQNNATYPASSSSAGQIRCNIPGDTGLIEWGKDFSCGPSGSKTTYMNPIPKDPKGGASSSIDHSYFYETDTPSPSSGTILGYTISAGLENSNDPEYCTPGAGTCVSSGKLPCNPASRHSYCVIEP